MRARTGRTWKRGTVLSAALLGSLVLVGLLVGANEAQSNDTEQDGEPEKAAQPCPGEVHYFAEDAPDGTNFFGPAAEGETVEELLEELRDRRCQDPALVVGHAIDAKLPGFDDLNGDKAIAAKIREVRDDPELWGDTITTLEEQEAEAEVEVTTMSGSYQTLYMVVREGKVPLIRQDAPDRPEFEVLRFTLPDGNVRNYKLDCGFQPVSQEFPGVPPLQPEQPTTTTAPPTTTTAPPTTTAQPPTVTTTPSPTTPTTIKCTDPDGDGICGTPDEGGDTRPAGEGPQSTTSSTTSTTQPGQPVPDGTNQEGSHGGGTSGNDSPDEQDGLQDEPANNEEDNPTSP